MHTTEEEVSPQSLHLRHLPIIPSLSPPYPSTPLQLPCLLTLSPDSLLPSITSCLCYGSRRGKSQGCSPQEQCCYETTVSKKKKGGGGKKGKKRKKFGALSREDQTRASLCCSYMDEAENRKRGVQVHEHEHETLQSQVSYIVGWVLV